MKNFILLVAIAFGLTHCGSGVDSEGESGVMADGSASYTIKNNTEKDLEEVFLNVMPEQLKYTDDGIDMGNFTEVQLKAGQCVTLSESDFERLFSIEVGGLLWGTNPLCSKDKDEDDVLPCKAGNYNIVEEGTVWDDYTLISANQREADCSTTLDSLAVASDGDAE